MQKKIGILYIFEFWFRDLKVTARHVMLRRLDQDGFVLVTDGRTQKARDLVNLLN